MNSDFIMADNIVTTDELYKRNPVNGNYMIEISMETYDKVFNEWDPSPFERREINPDFKDYLEICSEDIHLSENIELIFTGLKPEKNTGKEDNIRTGLHRYFKYNEGITKRDAKELNRLTIVYFTISLIFVTAMTFLNIESQKSIVLLIVYEGLTIGTWVFAWEAVATFVFRKREIYRRLKKWRRLSNAEIIFKTEQS